MNTIFSSWKKLFTRFNLANFIWFDLKMPFLALDSELNTTCRDLSFHNLSKCLPRRSSRWRRKRSEVRGRRKATRSATRPTRATRCRARCAGAPALSGWPRPFPCSRAPRPSSSRSVTRPTTLTTRTWPEICNVFWVFEKELKSITLLIAFGLVIRGHSHKFFFNIFYFSGTNFFNSIFYKWSIVCLFRDKTIGYLITIHFEINVILLLLCVFFIIYKTKF